MSKVGGYGNLLVSLSRSMKNTSVCSKSPGLKAIMLNQTDNKLLKKEKGHQSPKEGEAYLRSTA